MRDHDMIMEIAEKLSRELASFNHNMAMLVNRQLNEVRSRVFLEAANPSGGSVSVGGTNRSTTNTIEIHTILISFALATTPTLQIGNKTIKLNATEKVKLLTDLRHPLQNGDSVTLTSDNAADNLYLAIYGVQQGDSGHVG